MAQGSGGSLISRTIGNRCGRPWFLPHCGLGAPHGDTEACAFQLELLLLASLPAFGVGNRGEKIFALQEKGQGEVVEEVF